MITFMFLCRHRHSNLITFLAVEQRQAQLFHDQSPVGWGELIGFMFLMPTHVQQPFLTSLGTILLSSSSNCNYVVGSSNMTCSYGAASSNITWSYVVIFFFKLQGVPISTGRRGKMTGRHWLPPYGFFPYKTETPHFTSTKRSNKTTPRICHENEL